MPLIRQKNAHKSSEQITYIEKMKDVVKPLILSLQRQSVRQEFPLVVVRMIVVPGQPSPRRELRSNRSRPSRNLSRRPRSRPSDETTMVRIWSDSPSVVDSCIRRPPPFDSTLEMKQYFVAHKRVSLFRDRKLESQVLYLGRKIDQRKFSLTILKKFETFLKD